MSAPDSSPERAEADQAAPHDDVRASLRVRMRQLAQRYAAELPARDAHSLMLGGAMQGIELRFLPMGERDGAYDPERSVILINSQSVPERQRFTLAHEISHALLFTDDDLLSDLHDTFEDDALEQTIEVLCNVGASALLIPPETLAEVIDRFGYTGRALAQLVRRTQVSGSAALYALLEQASEAQQRVLLAVCSPSSAGELLVRVAAASAGVRYTLRTGTAIPDDHPAAKAVATGLHEHTKSYIPFRSGRKMPALVDAFAEEGGKRVFVSFDIGG